MERIIKADLLEDGPDFMVSIFSFLEDLQPQIDLRRRL
jgi:hypothetical protein